MRDCKKTLGNITFCLSCLKLNLFLGADVPCIFLGMHISTFLGINLNLQIIPISIIILKYLVFLGSCRLLSFLMCLLLRIPFTTWSPPDFSRVNWKIYRVQIPSLPCHRLQQPGALVILHLSPGLSSMCKLSYIFENSTHLAKSTSECKCFLAHHS